MVKVTVPSSGQSFQDGLLGAGPGCRGASLAESSCAFPAETHTVADKPMAAATPNAGDVVAAAGSFAPGACYPRGAEAPRGAGTGGSK
jgi:hypothetical protein